MRGGTVRLIVQGIIAVITADYPERCKTYHFNGASALYNGGLCTCVRRGLRQLTPLSRRQVLPLPVLLRAVLPWTRPTCEMSSVLASAWRRVSG